MGNMPGYANRKPPSGQPPKKHTWLCSPFAERQHSGGMISTKGRYRIRLELTTMPQERGHEPRRVRTYTLPTATCALRSLAPETQRQGALLPRHSQRGGALLPQHPQRQGALLPRYSQRRGTLLPQLPQRQGFRPPTPTVNTLSAVRPHVDGRARRLLACW